MFRAPYLFEALLVCSPSLGFSTVMAIEAKDWCKFFLSRLLMAFVLRLARAVTFSMIGKELW